MIVTIHTTNIETTPAIKKYVESKVKSIVKFYDAVVSMSIDIGLTSKHHNKGKIFYAEVTIKLPKKTVRVTKEAEDLYKAIDKVRDHLKLELKETKEKRVSRDKKVLRKMKEYQE